MKEIKLTKGLKEAIEEVVVTINGVETTRPLDHYEYDRVFRDDQDSNKDNRVISKAVPKVYSDEKLLLTQDGKWIIIFEHT